MGTREAMDRFGKRMADAERRSGKLPDSQAIERAIKEDFSKIRGSLKPGSSHPAAKERDGERK